MSLMSGETMNPMSLPNVTVSPKLLETVGVTITRADYRIAHSQLAELVWAVASQNPLWEVRIVSTSNSFAALKLFVIQDGEKLGEIGYEYNPRSGSNVYVVNQRIAAARSRNGGKQFSADNKRLLATIKKNFSRKTVGEKITDAENATTQALNTVVWDHSTRLGKLRHDLAERAVNYVSGVGKELFTQHLISIGMASNVDKLDKVVEAAEAVAVSSDIKDLYHKGELVLIVLDNDKYIVKYAVNTEMHDIESLPQTLRRSLGMLKLVEKGQVVSNSGMRVGENVFIVVQDKPE